MHERGTSENGARVSEPPETVIVRLRPHPRALFWPSVLLIALAGVAGYLGGRLPEPWQQIALLAAVALFTVVGWLVPLLAWLATSYTISTRRVVVQGGVLVRRRNELLHSRGYDVSLTRTLLQRVFGSGDVTVGTGPDRSLVLADVTSAPLVQSALNDLVERAGNGSSAFG